MVQHQDRRSATSGLRVTGLGPDALIQRDEHGGILISMPFAGIRTVRLNVEMAGPSSQVVCHVTDEDGREMVFGSMSWVRPGAWELQADTFRALLIALHQALTPWRDSIRFVEGPKAGFMLAMFALGGVTGAVCLAGFAWLFLWQENAVGLFLLAGVFAGGWLMRLFWPRAPKPYDPDRYALATPLTAPDKSQPEAG
ncbi:hypothetical protein [Maricaulis sp.]|uniref:hypothetical protein n=1 Tax=Maricaulis sp. TaxID=1486257 RepID=UPI003A8D56B2